MLLEEANAMLKTIQLTVEELDMLNPLYYVLNLDKDDFCKIVDLIGLDKLVQQQARYEMFERAEEAFRMKERYLKAKQELDQLEYEKEQLDYKIEDLKAIVFGYENEDLDG